MCKKSGKCNCGGNCTCDVSLDAVYQRTYKGYPLSTTDEKATVATTQELKEIADYLNNIEKKEAEGKSLLRSEQIIKDAKRRGCVITRNWIKLVEFYVDVQ